MSRWRAAAIHLSLSAIIGVVAAGLVFGLWYPSPYRHAAGADVLIFLLIGVDLVLGPMLTCIVFKSGKRGLKFDLWVIAIAQSTALTYGMSVIVLSRPVFLAAVIDRFSLVYAEDLSAEDLQQGAKPEFQSLSWAGPRLVAAVLPSSDKERTDVLFSSVGGKDVDKMPKYYMDYGDITTTFLKRGSELSKLVLKTAQDRARLDSAVASTHRERGDLLWFPITARKANLVMLVDRRTGAPLQGVEINPWPN